MSHRFRAVLEKLRSFPAPVIAALNGDAFGGGAELAMACDLRIAAGHAQIGFLQGKLAISTAWGGGPDLFAALGISRALRLLARAEILSAPRALDWGLRSEEHTSELQSLRRISYAVFCLKKK